MKVKLTCGTMPKLSDVLVRRGQTLVEFMKQLKLTRESLIQYCIDNNLVCPALPEVKPEAPKVVKPVVAKVQEVVEKPAVVVTKKPKVVLPVVQDVEKKLIAVG